MVLYFEARARRTFVDPSPTLFNLIGRRLECRGSEKKNHPREKMARVAISLFPLEKNATERGKDIALENPPEQCTEQGTGLRVF